ncbi:MAG: hypothetical protein OXE58_00690 [Acidobacteria bacterium]|nr:hypothetical protein [Acidobacteriota bacterium]
MKRLSSSPRPARWQARALVVVLGVSVGIPIASGYQLVRGRSFVWPSEQRPVPYWVANVPDNWMTVDQVVAETRAAFDTWAAPEQVGVSFSYQGKTNLRPFDFFDRTNTVGFSTREHMAELGLSEVTLAVTSWLADMETGAIAEADILVNPAYTWTDIPDSGFWDYRTSLIHEAGHFMGLGHSGVGRQSAVGLAAGSAVMWPYTFGRGNSLGRTLTADDITGASVLYPSASTPSGQIYGEVRHASGEAVAYAHVVAYEPLVDLTVGAWADGEGNYEIAGLPDGVYVLRANPIPANHSDGAYFFPFGRVARNFSATVHPRLVVISGAGATEARIEVGQ